VGNQCLFRSIRHKCAVIADPKTEGDDPAEVAVALVLVPLDLSDTFADAVAFGLGDRGQDGEDQLADAVAGHIPAQVNHVQADAAGLQLRARCRVQVFNGAAVFGTQGPEVRILSLRPTNSIT
jgi:hypothetical protein